MMKTTVSLWRSIQARAKVVGFVHFPRYLWDHAQQETDKVRENTGGAISVREKMRTSIKEWAREMQK